MMHNKLFKWWLSILGLAMYPGASNATYDVNIPQPRTVIAHPSWVAEY